MLFFIILSFFISLSSLSVNLFYLIYLIIYLFIYFSISFYFYLFFWITIMFPMARNGEQFCALSKTENLAFC